MLLCGRLQESLTRCFVLCQHAAMEKEQWNDTRNLRQKVNKRTEKEWDRADAAFDNRDKCEQSANINAYWEPNTLRCLDRRTGRVITP